MFVTVMDFFLFVNTPLCFLHYPC